MEVGTTVEKYLIEATRGQGGMATVYQARHVQLGSLHAIKVVHANSRSVFSRLLQEGRAQATLRHPNLVPVTDVIEFNGNPALVMEYVEGPSLDEWLKHHRPTREEAVRLFTAIVRGVRHAHRKGFIHRDLKPANILVREGDDGLQPMVTDFGLVKAMEDEARAGSTQDGATMGTPGYMAPEQIRDARNVDHRADMFALGCIFYDLLCGKPAFTGSDMLAMYNAAARGTYIRPSVAQPGVDATFDAVIADLLEVDPDRRLADCDRLLEALGPLGGTPGPGASARASTTDDGGTLRTSTTLQSSETMDPRRNPLGNHFEQSALRHDATPSPVARRTTSVASARTMLPMVAIGVAGVLVVSVGLSLGLSGELDGPALATPPASAAALPPAVVQAPAPVAPAPVAADPPEPAPAAAPPRPLRTPVAAAPAVSTPAPAVSTPAPAVSTPAPAVSTPAPAVVVVPLPEPAPVATGRVTVAGDATEVWLVGSAGRVSIGDAVPAGSYEVQAVFDGAAPVAAGRVTIPADASVELRCVSIVARCKI